MTRKQYKITRCIILQTYFQSSPHDLQWRQRRPPLRTHTNARNTKPVVLIAITSAMFIWIQGMSLLSQWFLSFLASIHLLHGCLGTSSSRGFVIVDSKREKELQWSKKSCVVWPWSMFTEIMNVSRENILGQFDEMGSRKIEKLQFEWQFDHIFKSYLLHVSTLSYHSVEFISIWFEHITATRLPSF